MEERPVVIVGGGLAGLVCAKQLFRSGVPFLLLEASDRFGGRVCSVEVDHFRLDLGFQVLLTSYPEAARQLDFDALKLGRFQSGALIRHNGKFVRMADPWRAPRYLLSTALSSVGTWRDKLRMARLRSDVCQGAAEELLERPETTTLIRLQTAGFSSRMIESFFRPFFGGVFLEPELETSSRKFDYLFRMFATGQAALPAGGMEKIPQQLSASLPSDRLRLSTPVRRVTAQQVELESGQVIAASQVVVACDPWNASRLVEQSSAPAANATSVVYFAAAEAPLKEPTLVLNGEGRGPVNSLCVPSQVSSGYAPSDQALISVSVLGVKHQEDDSQLTAEILAQLRGWFGPQVERWRHLRTFHIRRALPSQRKLDRSMNQPRFERLSSGVIVCGDGHDVASIQGAMQSGREAAEHLVAQNI